MTTRGGQTVLMSDVDGIRSRAWHHRFHGWATTDDRHTCTGPAEVHNLVDTFVLSNMGPRKIGKSPPHITAENFVLSDSILLSWIGLVSKDSWG